MAVVASVGLVAIEFIVTICFYLILFRTEGLAKAFLRSVGTHILGGIPEWAPGFRNRAGQGALPDELQATHPEFTPPNPQRIRKAAQSFFGRLGAGAAQSPAGIAFSVPIH